jgi:predicted CopG family antitoxin
MHKKMTISLEEAVYDGLYRTVGKRKMSQFIENLIRPHVIDSALDAGYKAMAKDVEREAEAKEWCESLGKDVLNASR